MTYRELQEVMAGLTERQLDFDVTIYLQHQNEFYGLDPDVPWYLNDIMEDDRLDDDHPYLRS